MSIVTIIPPQSDVISVDELKAHLRITSTHEDEYLKTLIETAREYCEEYQNRRYVTDVADDYRPFYKRAKAAVEKTESAEPPDEIARRVHRIITREKPRSRYPAGKGMTATALLLQLLPGFIREQIFIRYYGIHRGAKETDG